MAEVYGTKKVFGISMFLCAILSALTPLSTASVWLVFTLRVVQGLLESSNYPACNPMTNKWIPAEERGKFVSFAYMGEGELFYSVKPSGLNQHLARLLSRAAS